MSLLNLLAHDRNVILYRPELNKITGSPNASILLSQIIYWSTKYDHDEFYKNIFIANKKAKENNQQCWSEELGFTRRQIETAFYKLKSKNLIIVKVNSLEHNTYIKLNKDELNKQLETVYNGDRKSKKGECTKRTLGDGGKRQSGLAVNANPSITETTQRLHREASSTFFKRSKEDLELIPTAHKIKKLMTTLSAEDKIKIKCEVEKYLSKFPVIKNVKSFRLGVLNATVKKYASH